MKINLLYTLLLLLLFSSCNDSNGNKAVDKNAYSENLNEYFSTLAKLNKFNGGVLIQKGGEIIHSRIYTMDVTQVPTLKVSMDSQFDIHSISKVMAHATVAKLQLEGKINKEDKVAKFIPSLPYGNIVTIDNLITNTSGLPRELSDVPDNLIEMDPNQLVNLIAKEALLFTPGEEHLYSNLGYQLLYFIISQVVEKPFVQYLNEEYFVPLKMDDSGAHFHLKRNNLTRLVKNHENDDGKITVVPNIEPDGKNQAKIYSTLADLLKFVDHLKDAPYKSELINDKNEIGWSGGGDGILSHMKAAIGSDYEVVFFSNYDEIPFGDILQAVENIMTDSSFDLPTAINRQAIELDRNILQKYVGRYQVKEFNNDTFEFRVEEGGLVFYQNGERNTEVSPESETIFFSSPDAEDFFEFRKNAQEEFQLIYNYKKHEIVGDKIKD